METPFVLVQQILLLLVGALNLLVMKKTQTIMSSIDALSEEIGAETASLRRNQEAILNHQRKAVKLAKDMIGYSQRPEVEHDRPFHERLE